MARDQIVDTEVGKSKLAKNIIRKVKKVFKANESKRKKYINQKIKKEICQMKQIMKKINFSRPLKCIHGILLIMYRNYTWKFNSDTKHSID